MLGFNQLDLHLGGNKISLIKIVKLELFAYGLINLTFKKHGLSKFNAVGFSKLYFYWERFIEKIGILSYKAKRFKFLKKYGMINSHCQLVEGCFCRDHYWLNTR